MGENRKSGIETMYETEEARRGAEKTFICIGAARGGTSAVGGVMQRLGIFMGEGIPNNYEDPDFIHKPMPHMKEAVARRNESYAIWGFKAPNAANFLEVLLPTIRNPHLIVVYRDLVATMKGHIRWHNRSQLGAVHEILMQHQKNWFLIDRWKIPTAMVSYEKAILAPEVFARDMADFIAAPRPEGAALREIAAFLSPGSYK